MGEIFKCARCTNCCRPYWITLFPEEAEAIAKLLRTSQNAFFKKYCVLLLQAFPMNKPDFSNPLIIPVGRFPKRLSEKSSASFFLALPSIAFKRSPAKHSEGSALLLPRESGTCVMLSKNGLCKVHAVRPLQCRLFPLIGLKEKTSLKKAHSFCKGLKGSEKVDLRKNQAHYKRIRQYFESVKKQGFRKVWKHWPSKGIVLLESEKISKISAKEFFKTLGF